MVQRIRLRYFMVRVIYSLAKHINGCANNSKVLNVVFENDKLKEIRKIN